MATPQLTPTPSDNAAQEMADRMDYLSRRSHGEPSQTRLQATITERHEDLNQRIQNAGAAAIGLQQNVQEIGGNLLEEARGMDVTAPERAQLERLQIELQELEITLSTLTSQLKNRQQTMADVNETTIRLKTRQKELERLLTEKEASLRRPSKVSTDLLAFGNEIIKKASSSFAKKS